ncbi:MAG: aldo/keto reductase [Acidobacteria bacterium]|nr:aldo/keto reductase [Acidobacteriota bacterium]
MTVPRIDLVDDYSVPRHIVGLWQLSGGHQTSATSAEAALRAMEAYFEAGYDTFDCADIYTGVEDLLGQFRDRLGSRAARLQVHTKYVPDRGALAQLDRSAVEAAIDRSLRRLQCERLDLVQFAWWDYETPGYVDVVGWLGEIRETGKIRHIGTTNFDVERLDQMATIAVPMVAHQVQYSILDRRPTHGLTAFLDETESAMVCYGSLAGGLLSDRWLDVPEPDGPLANRSLTKYRLIVEEIGGWHALQNLLRVLREIADGHHSEVAHIASAWVLDQPRVAAAIIGMRNAKHLTGARQAFSVALTKGDKRRILDWQESHPGPAGDTFGLERDPEGPHSAIMWTDLNSEPSKPAQ